MIASVDLLAFFADRLKVQLREQGARHDLVDAVLALGQGSARGAEAEGEMQASPSPLAGEGRGEGSGTGPSVSGGESQNLDAGGRPLSPTLPRKGGGSQRPTVEGSTIAEPRTGAVQDDLLLIVRRVEALGKFLDTEDGRNLLAGYKRAANILREEEKKSAETYDGKVDPQRLAEPEEKALFEAIGAAEGEARAAVDLEDFDRAMQALARLRVPVDAFFDKVLVNSPDPTVRANRLRLLNRIREATRAVADFSKVEG